MVPAMQLVLSASCQAMICAPQHPIPARRARGATGRSGQPSWPGWPWLATGILRRRLVPPYAEQLAAQPTRLPCPFALGAEVVCVAEHQSARPRLAVAPRARYPRIEIQRQDVAADQHYDKENYFQTSVPFRLLYRALIRMQHLLRPHRKACRTSQQKHLRGGHS